MTFDKQSQVGTADVLKALGHPTRLWIVKELCDGEHCVCEFVEAVGDAFPTISRHLAVLKDAGVVSDRRDGKSIYYRLARPCIAQFLDCLEGKKCKR